MQVCRVQGEQIRRIPNMAVDDPLEGESFGLVVQGGIQRRARERALHRWL